MDPGPLRKLWTSRKAAELPPELRAALADLDRLAADRPELAPPARDLAPLLRAAFSEPVPPPRPWADDEAHLEARSRGLPAFVAHPPPIDARALRARALELCAALPGGNLAASVLRTAIRKGTADPASWWPEALAGRPESLDREAEALSVPPALTRSVLRLALLPALAGCSKAVPPIAHEGEWDRGDCPNCGSPPVLAESLGLEARRSLRCGLCASSWPASRLRCIACGEDDPHALRSISVEGEADRHRLVRCRTCHHALKVVSALAPLSPPGLLVAELATVHLDLIAQGEEGGDGA